MNKTVQKAIRAEYALLRTPLAVLDDRVLARLGDHSRLRSTVGRAVAGLDAAAARLLPDHESDSDRNSAGAPAGAPTEHTVPVEEVEYLAEELKSEQEQHDLKGELAEDEELRRVQAELRAKHRMEELEQG